MFKPRIMRVVKMLAAGACLLQSSGCTQQEFLEFLQTVFLGFTAAGSIAILQNI